MVRSVGIAMVVLGLAWTGFAGAQSSSPLEKARYIMVNEEGKPPQRCKLLKTWREAGGAPVFQVQAVDTGEMMTIVGTAPQGSESRSREMSTRIFRWGRDNKPPAGAPLPPPTAAVGNPSPAVPTPDAGTSTAAAATPPRPISVSQAVRKPNPAPAPASTQPPSPPYILTNNKPAPSAATAKPNAVVPNKSPSLTPMGTQVVQYSPIAKQGDSLPATAPSATNSQPRLAPLPAGSSVNPKSCTCTCPPPPCGTCSKVCNPCGQSSCVCGTPSPMRQPLISRLFKSNSPCDCTAAACQPTSSVAAQSGGTNQPVSSVAAQSGGTNVGKTPLTPTGANTPPPAPSVATQSGGTSAAEPAKPGDWRQSWGKVESWKGSVQASSVKPIEVSKRVESTPVQIEPSTQPDPLKAPDQYRDIVMNARLTNSKIPQPGQPSKISRLKELVAKPGRDRKGAALPPNRSFPAAAPTPTAPAAEEGMAAAPPPATDTPGTPPAQSPSRVIMISADEPNAFWSPQPPGAATQNGGARVANNAFDREPAPPPQGIPPASTGIMPNGPTSVPPVLPGIMQGPPPQGLVLKNAPHPPTAPYTPPPGPPQPMAPDTGVPDAMANAFTLSATRRPIPADFGGTPQEPNGFDPPVQMGDGSPPRAYGMAAPGAYRPPMPNAMAMGPQAPIAVNPLMRVPPSISAQSMGLNTAAAAAPPAGVPQLLAALKDSLRPSEREAAAEQLSELSWRVQPLVVEGLMKSAREDPAATVRAACIRALAHMKVTTPAALALVRDLKTDRDLRVRQEAEEALNALGDSGIQQASHK
jgi:hypothetical protein